MSRTFQLIHYRSKLGTPTAGRGQIFSENEVESMFVALGKAMGELKKGEELCITVNVDNEP